MPSMNVSVEYCANADASPNFSCPLCCVEKSTSELTRLTQCSHESCRECIVKWIEKAESSGQSTPPLCPFCRLELTREETASLLGRPFLPRTTTTSTFVTPELDDLTLQWLRDQTQTCPGCGACIEKIQGGCDMMECLCGFRFCFACGSPHANCSCTPPDHYFWDNCFDRQAQRTAPPMASPDQETGCVNLQKYITKRKREEQAKLVREERRFRRDIEEEERLEEDEWSASANWLYCTRNREATLRVLGHLLNRRLIPVEMTRGIWVMSDSEVEATGVGAGRWLYGKSDSGFTFLSHYLSSKAVILRGRRLKSRANKSKELTGVDAAFSSGKWLYYRKSNAGTRRQIKWYSKQQRNETAVEFDRWWSWAEEDEICDCGDFKCELCLKEENEKVICNRVFFLDEEAKEREMKEITQYGL